MSGSVIFEPFRALGFVATGSLIAFHEAKNAGGESYLVTSIGKTFHTYDANTFALTSVGPEFTSNITLLEAHSHDNQILFVCLEGSTDIYVIRRRLLVCVLRAHNKPVTQLLSLGPILVSVSASEHKLITWNISDVGEATANISSLVDSDSDVADPRIVNVVALPEDSTVTSIVHPPTYQDKLLLGTVEGHLDLINVRKGAHDPAIYRFGPYNRRQSALADRFKDIVDVSKTEFNIQATPRVSCITCSHVLDVVAIGLSDGQIILLNLKFDKILTTFTHEPGPVTALTFRTEGADMLLSASQSEIAVWDLNKRRIHTVMKSIHDGGVAAFKMLPRQPVLITLGGDNCLKAFIFDQEDGSGRMIRQVSGHSQPPTMVRFYDPFGAYLITSGSDRTLRVTATRGTAHYSREMSQRLAARAKATHVSQDALRMRPVIDCDTSFLREADWENVVTCHDKDDSIRLWSMNTFSLSVKRLQATKSHTPNQNNPRQNKANRVVKCVALSTCGHFVCVGRADGSVEKFNIQSGQHRGTCTRDREQAHSGPVHGIIVDGINKQIVSAGYDAAIRFWDFVTVALITELQLDSPISKIVANLGKSLLAVACDDFSVRVVDMDTHKVVRLFQGHTNMINDLTFTHDSRQLVTCSMDGSIRVFDIISGLTVDWFNLPLPCTSLSIHPEGLFLATTHVGSVGVFMWINKLRFGEVFLREVTTACNVVLPTTADHPSSEPTGSEIEKTEENHEVDANGEHTDGIRNRVMQAPLKRQEMLKTAAAATKRLSSLVENGLSEIDTKKQKSADFVTLSDVPKHIWKSLPNLDIIREKNKPVQPKQKLLAPFFLTATQGLEPKFVKNTTEATTTTNSNSNNNGLFNADDLRAISNDIEGGGPNTRNALAQASNRLFVDSSAAIISQLDGEEAADSEEVETQYISTDLATADDADSDNDEELEEAEHRGPLTQARKSLVEEYEEAGPTSKSATGKTSVANMSNLMMAKAFRIYSRQSSEPKNYDEVIEMLKQLPPATIDVMIRTISSRREEMTVALDMFACLLEAKRHFDFVQSLLNLFLKVHSDVIIASEELVPLVQRLNEVQKNTWGHTENLFTTNNFLVRFLAKLPF